MQRHQFERERHRKLIDKRDKVDAIIHSLREQNADDEQIKEVEDILSPVEKEQIQKLDAAFRKYERKIFCLNELLLNYFLELNLLNFNLQKQFFFLKCIYPYRTVLYLYRRKRVAKPLPKNYLNQCRKDD
jgi:hypothetical protein